jgi:outer membrane receptor for ferrienterochelin and colicin
MARFIHSFLYMKCKQNIIISIRKGVILTCLLSIFISNIFSQIDTTFTGIQNDILSTEDLVFSIDSSRLKMISAGRISKNLDELPLTVYVVSHEEILRNQYNSLIDVLNSLPGIVTSQPGTGELGESFQIWGLTGNLYTKILVNGLPVKPSVVTGMPIGSQLPIREADKIEVIYGTSSSVYGADAVSGVINIITKEAEKGTFVRGDISLGEDGYNYINFFLGGKAGKNNNILQYSFYGSKSEYDNMDVKYAEVGVYNPLNYYQQQEISFDIGGESYEPLEINESILRRHGVDPEEFKSEYYGKFYEGSVTQPEMENLSSDAHMMGLQLRFRGIRLSYDNMYRRTHSSLGLSPVFYKYNNPQNYWGEGIQRISLSYTKDLKRFSSSTQISSLVYQMDNNSSQGVTFLNNTDKVYRYSASNDLLLEQVFSASLIKNLELVMGLSYQQSTNLPVTNYLWTPFNKKDYKPLSERVVIRDTLLDGFGMNPVNFSNISEFLQFYYILNKFRFLGGIRYDINTLYGNRFSPQLGVLFKTGKKISLHLSAGSAYKAPPSSIVYQSLAYPVDNGQIDYQVIPGSELKPEKFTTLELGFTRPFFKRAMVHQTFFYYRITDHIIPETFPMSDFNFPNAANDSVRTWINNKHSISNVVGSQTTLLFEDLIRSVHLNAEISLSFLNRQDKLPNVMEIVTNYLSLMPKHSGKLKVSLYPVKNLYVNVESLWMTKWLRLLIPFEDLYNELFKETDGYYAMNVLASYDISDNLNVFLKVTNLFDEKYGSVNATILNENLVYNPQLRRTMRIGLSYKLN